jgi:imidazolonepropionase-like amidohydrolase
MFLLGILPAVVAFAVRRVLHEPEIFVRKHAARKQNSFSALVSDGQTIRTTIGIAILCAVRFLQLENEFGTIALGRRADLLLLSANPLLDVGNMAKREGVMVRGNWFPEAELHARLKSLAQVPAP